MSDEKQREYWQTELKHALDLAAGSNTVRAQVGVFLGTANLAALGVAFSSRKAGVFLVGAAILAVLLINDQFLRTTVRASFARAIWLQDRLSNGADDTLLRMQPTRICREAADIADKPTSAARIEAARRPMFGDLLSSTRARIVLLVIALECLAPLFALTREFRLF